MKKMTARIPDDFLRCCVPLADIVERLEVVSLFNISPGAHTEICNITLGKGVSIDALKNELIDDLIVLKNEGQDYMCLIKGKFSAEVSAFIGQFDLRLEYPIIYGDGKCQLSMVGSSDELYTIVQAARNNRWDLEILSVREYDPHVSSVLNALTNKQKEVLLQAYSSGYFDLPRKIDADGLAKKMGIHKTTLLEHLHKAEKRLIGNIVEHMVDPGFIKK